jgi:UDP-N-acetylglucosamine 1-carboxyvinyltransferase
MILIGVHPLEKFVINGGRELNGKVRISGAKNAAVAILPAVLLTNETCIIENLPEISDVGAILRVIKELGADVRYINRDTVEINCKNVNTHIVTKQMAENLTTILFKLMNLRALFKTAFDSSFSLSALMLKSLKITVHLLNLLKKVTFCNLYIH